LPDILRQITVPWIANGNPEAGENIKVLCFVIGLTQLGIAHVKNFLRDWPSPRLIAQIGQIGMLAGIFFLVLNLVISPARFPLPEWAPASIGIGFALNFLFANFDDSSSLPRGFIKGVLDSLKNIVPVLLGVVNIFADVVSYIRLWAVGLAGLAISQTVNNMAGPLLGSFVLFAGGVFLLLFGHGLNLVMALLSVIVHGVRLNMLEFSSHLGMEWSGYKYEPFADPAANKQG
jgi:V/A-type H+/Na+-transporting ATPase subunit I